MGEETRALRVLVTGGQGFLGGALIRALRDLGFSNLAATARREAPELEALGVEVVRADLTVREQAVAATRGRDFIFHTAAKAGVWGDLESYRAINVDATRFLLEGAAEHGAGHFVHTSSPSVTFQGDSSLNKDESAPYGRKPYNAYCATKIESERLVLEGDWNFQRLALRPHLIYGAGDPHLLPRVFDAAEKGRLLRVGDGLSQVDVTHIKDTVASHLCALAQRDRAEAWGEAYFITSGRPIRLWAWLGHLLQWKGLPRVRRSLSLKKAVMLGAALEKLYAHIDKGEPRLTRFSALQLGCSHTYSIEKARRLLGYEPMVDPYSPFEQQFEEVMDWTCFSGLNP